MNMQAHIAVIPHHHSLSWHTLPWCAAIRFHLAERLWVMTVVDSVKLHVVPRCAAGVFTKEQLAAVAPGKDVVLLDSLEDTDAVMRAMGLA